LSFFVDPFGLFFFGAILYILVANLHLAKSLTYALASAILTCFILGGAALYFDWYRWVIHGLADLKGSYIIFDQGLTGITKEAFPVWIVMMFLALYPFWFILGYETAKKYSLPRKFLILFIIGILLLAIPSIIQSQFFPHS
jgi:uncharacterized membrane protein